ncbi:MAG: cytochrome c-type biogenesis protein CcmH [Armatimonadota bacterium]|nr:cytochrome c-type biogenesis protein CcmH [Armatimonadota bacterium]MDR5696722.1 cytochrome c-type biogenesis protein CcmH [Armatimonadota bacterium]
MNRRRHPLSGSAVAAVLALLVGVGPPALGQTLDDRVREIASQLMCPVCEGRTVADSPSELAGQMREIIRQKLRAGESPEEIVAYFVDRYGPAALAAPARSGFGLLVWLAPAFAIAAGALFLFLRFRTDHAPAHLVGPALSSEEGRHLRRLLGEAEPEDDGVPS